MTTQNNAQQVKPYLQLEELVSTLRQWRESKIDFVADARHLSFDPITDGIQLVPASHSVAEWMPMEGWPLRPWAVGQLAGRMNPEIPIAYLRRLAEQRPVVASHLLRETRPQKRWFIRSLQGHVRAVLSDQYRVIDHLDLAAASLDAVKEAGGEAIYAQLDERKMRLSFTTRDTWDILADAEKNHGRGSHHFDRFGGNDEEPGKVHPLVTVSNSETGDGGASVRFGILVARCTNTAIIETAISQVHLGGRMDVGIVREDTQRAEGLAISLKLRDAIHAGLHPNTFARMVDLANKAQEKRIEDARGAASNVLALAGINADKAIDDLLGYFLKDYDSTAYGLSQAVARYAQDQSAPAEVEALETAAGAVLRGELAVA